MSKHELNLAAVLAPLEVLAASLRAAGYSQTLLARLPDPTAANRLPAAPRAAVAAYLDTLPGYRAGDFPRAREQHRLRWELMRGVAQAIEEADLAALGLEESSDPA